MNAKTQRRWNSRLAGVDELIFPGGEHVLIVEDDAAVRTIAGRTLARLGYHVTTAADGDEALLRGAQPERAIDLVITDVVMPGISGFELGRRMRRLRPGVPLLYMSGYGIERLRGQEVHAFIEKPFTPEALGSSVREALDAERVDAGRGTRGRRTRVTVAD